MKKLSFLCLVFFAVILIIPANAADHTIQWQNHCPYEVSVVIIGGLQYTNPFDGKVYGASQCMPPDQTCQPNTKCPYTACGEGNKNKCDQGAPLVDNGGFILEADTPGAKNTHASTVPKFWQGSFQPRTNCHFDADKNYVCDYEPHTCRAYQDGQGKVECGGHQIQDATKGEINFDENGVDTYDVSAVDGFNIPITIELVPGTGSAEGLAPVEYACTKAGTNFDLRDLVGTGDWKNLDASKLLIKNAASTTIAVRSACSYASALNHKNNDPHFDEKDYLTNSTCCKLPFGSAQDFQKNGNMKCDPQTWPSDINTAAFFKHFLPTAYSYAYDDHTSTYTCKNKDDDTLTAYIVTFCGGNEGSRVTLPGDDTHSHLPDLSPTPLPTPVPTSAPLPAQTPVPSTHYNPAESGDVNF